MLIFNKYIIRIVHRSDKWLNIVLLVSLMFTVSFKGAPEKRAYSRLKRNGIHIDGALEDWDNQGQICLKGEKGKSENRVIFRSRWDIDTLYLSFDVQDRDLRAYQIEKDDPRLFLDDMVEMLIDAKNRKDSCWGTDDIVYHINIRGDKKDDRGTALCQSDPSWDGCARYAVKIMGTLNDTTDVDDGYSVEVGIPWTELGLIPKSGLKIGFNFANGDNDGKGRQLFDWAGAWPMRSPYAFGTLILKGEEKR